MTSSEIIQLYSQIDGMTSSEIKNVISDELSHVSYAGFGKHAFAARDVFSRKWTSEEVMDVCKTYVMKSSSSIKEILRKNPKVTNYALDVIQLVAPAIAQQYGGLSSMAIVGSLSILCKQGITNYIA